jgi:2-dehydro-3-deoxyphosphogluconate aldolase/(4S)-4-hydroxy-2-oxoglutarate aldolase
MTLSKAEILARIREIGLVPVVRAATADEALKVADAIRAGGVPILEITLTVPGALSVIEQVAKRFGADVLLGAGTVLDAEAARASVQAGAQFVVSPATDAATIAWCRSADVPVFPGALTPTEVLAAWNAGADAVKIFPCGAVGGPSYLKSLKAPLPQIEMIPTGGVSTKTAADFIAAGALALGVGADLADTQAIRDGKSSQVTDKAREYLRLVQAARASRVQ